MGYFIRGPATEVDRVACVETTRKVHNACSDIFTGIGASKEHFLYWSKIMQSHIRHCLARYVTLGNIHH